VILLKIFLVTDATLQSLETVAYWIQKDQAILQLSAHCLPLPSDYKGGKQRGDTESVSTDAHRNQILYQ
jgi:hypothetical protein